VHETRYINRRLYLLPFTFAICHRKSIRLSVRPFVTWVDQSKTFEVRVMQFSPHRHSRPIPLPFMGKVSSRNYEGFPQAGASNKGVLGETCYFRSSNAFARWLHKLQLRSIAAEVSDFKLNRQVAALSRANRMGQITRAVLSPGNCAKPCKFRYVKPVWKVIWKILRSTEKTRIFDDRDRTVI